MANKLITALKENENDIRKKVVIVGGIVVATVVAGVVLTKMNNQNTDTLVLFVEDATDLATEVAPE